MSDNEFITRKEFTEFKQASSLENEICKEQIKSFKIRICIIFNICIVGLGFLVLGKGYLVGIISFVVFYSSIIFAIYNHYLLYFIPLIVWIVSQMILIILTSENKNN